MKKKRRRRKEAANIQVKDNTRIYLVHAIVNLEVKFPCMHK